MKKILVILYVLAYTALNAQVKVVLPCSKQLLEASLDSALAQVGTVESTNRNDGAKIEEYLSSVGRNRGNAYCAAGQYWCFWVAAKQLNLPFSVIPIKRTGLANEMFNDASKRGDKVIFEPSRHDLLVWRKANKANGHIERIIRVAKAGWVYTIGFNTSPSKSSRESNGEGVYIRKRNVYHSLGRLAVRGLIGFKVI
jgi:hypothetical protein